MIKKIPQQGLILLLSAVLISCVSVKIQSNKDPEFVNKVSRIFITARGSDSSNKYLKSLTTHLVQELKKQNIEASVYHFDPLSLKGEKDILEKITEYAPDVVMSMNQTEKMVWNGGFLAGTTDTGATFDIRLYQPGKEDPVWRAALINKSDVGVEATIYRSVKKLIEKLKLDGIIN